MYQQVISDRVAKMFNKDLGSDIKHFSVKGDLVSLSERAFGNTEHTPISKKMMLMNTIFVIFTMGKGNYTETLNRDLNFWEVILSPRSTLQV